MYLSKYTEHSTIPPGISVNCLKQLVWQRISFQISKMLRIYLIQLYIFHRIIEHSKTISVAENIFPNVLSLYVAQSHDIFTAETELFAQY